MSNARPRPGTRPSAGGAKRPPARPRPSKAPQRKMSTRIKDGKGQSLKKKSLVENARSGPVSLDDLENMMQDQPAELSYFEKMEKMRVKMMNGIYKEAPEPDRRVVRKVCKVPAHAKPGDKIRITHGGKFYNIPVPAGQRRFIVELPAEKPPKIIQKAVQVPEGARPGDRIKVKHNGWLYTVPLHKIPKNRRLIVELPDIPPPPQPKKEDSVSILTKMGFDEEIATAALNANGQNVEAAAHWIVAQLEALVAQEQERAAAQRPKPPPPPPPPRADRRATTSEDGPPPPPPPPAARRGEADEEFNIYGLFGDHEDEGVVNEGEAGKPKGGESVLTYVSPDLAISDGTIVDGKGNARDVPRAEESTTTSADETLIHDARAGDVVEESALSAAELAQLPTLKFIRDGIVQYAGNTMKTGALLHHTPDDWGAMSRDTPVGLQLEMPTGGPTHAPEDLGADVKISVPPGAKAGSKLRIVMDDGEEFLLTVPEGAQPGDQLEFRAPVAKTASVQGFELTINMTAVAKASLTDTAAKEGEESDEFVDVFSVPIPPDAKPGQVLLIDMGKGTLIPVQVPEDFVPGDEMRVKTPSKQRPGKPGGPQTVKMVQAELEKLGEEVPSTHKIDKVMKEFLKENKGVIMADSYIVPQVVKKWMQKKVTKNVSKGKMSLDPESTITFNVSKPVGMAFAEDSLEIVAVEEGSEAGKAGVVSGATLVGAGTVTFENLDHLKAFLDANTKRKMALHFKAPWAVPAEVLEDDSSMAMASMLGITMVDTAFSVKFDATLPLGLTFTDTPTSGVLVLSVDADGQAGGKGVVKGAMVVAANRLPVKSQQDLVQAHHANETDMLYLVFKNTRSGDEAFRF